MPLLKSFLPDPETILELAPEDLALLLLEYLKALPSGELQQLNRTNFLSKHSVQTFPSDLQDDLLRALAQAWRWLEQEGVITDRPGNRDGFVELTKRAAGIESKLDLARLRQVRLLPRDLLHPGVVRVAWPPFLRGDYDSAVLESFKAVEVALRVATGLPSSDVGVKLVQKAFHVTNGKLTDPSATEAERLAILNLFAGAFGLFRNRSVHRYTSMGTAACVEIVCLASRLMNLVDERATP